MSENNLITIMNNRDISINDLSLWTKIKRERLESVVNHKKLKRQEEKIIAEVLHINKVHIYPIKKTWINKSINWIRDKWNKFYNGYMLAFSFLILFFILMAILIGTINILSNYYAQKSINQNDVYAVSALSALFFGVAGFLFSSRAINYDLSVNVITIDGYLYLELLNKSNRDYKNVYLILDDVTKLQIRNLKIPRKKEFRNELSKLDFQGLFISKNTTFLVKIGNRDALSRLEENILVKFLLLQNKYKREYSFFLKTYL